MKYVIFSKRFKVFRKTKKNGKQEFRRTDFGSRLLAAESEGGGGQ
jgi:hypothetical protein